MVWNDALTLVESTPDGEKWLSIAEVQKICRTQAKQTAGREWRAEVSQYPVLAVNLGLGPRPRGIGNQAIAPAVNDSGYFSGHQDTLSRVAP